MGFLGDRHRSSTLTKSLAVAVTASLASITLAPAPVSAGDGLRFEPSPIVIDTNDPSVDPHDPVLMAQMLAVHDDFEADSTSLVATSGPMEPGLPMASAVNSGLSVAFENAVPNAARTVILAAATRWDEALATTPGAPVVIDISWSSLGGTNVLGSAGPNGLYAGSSLPTSDYYPAALANTLLGYDINGANSAEIIVNLNSGVNWHLSVDGTPTWNEIDLLSVVMHEIGHGLGFLGSASVNNGSSGDPALDSTPFVFDRQVLHNGSGLLNLANPDGLLESNNLDVVISDSLMERLYAPGSWQEGSSFSHFDESSHPHGSPGALMTPSLGSAETERNLDAATLGLMAGIGWPMRVAAATPDIVSLATGPGQITVNLDRNLHQSAVAPDSYRLEAWQGSALRGSVLVPASMSTAIIGGLGTTGTHTVKVTPVVFGRDGAPTTSTVVLDQTALAPRAVGVAGSGLSRTVTWLTDSGAPPSTYEVQRSSDGGSWVNLGSTTSLSFPVTVSSGVHQFRVRANASGALSAWASSIPVGIGDGVVRPVPLDGQLSRLYQAYFRRLPDANGFSYWLGERAKGSALELVSDAFASSSEFQAAYGSLSNQQFVDLVYQNVLGRSPDAAGRSYWVAVLASGVSRGAVMTGFSESGELVANTGTAPVQSTADAEIYRLYVAFFLRAPDANGAVYWAGIRSGGAPLEVIAAAFASSMEFQANYGSLSNADFVELVYNNVLARSPDTAGMNYWQGRLASGVSRGAAMVGFSESAEFVLATGTVR